MIICQNCKSQELDGTIFCSECGAQLQTGSSPQTHKFSIDADELQGPPANANRSSIPHGTWVSLHLLDSGKVLPFVEHKEFTLGRLSEDQPIEPDIDLTPYKAYENGVSRLHAVIRYSEGLAVLVDLGSSNGTYLNGLRIVPNAEQPLRHGDIVALGKLKMQIVLS